MMPSAIAAPSVGPTVRPAASRPLTLALITPARNEEALIESTIRSVIAQTVRPSHWVIVSDGSTDRTDEIVQHYAQAHPWIELVRMPERHERHFAAKAHCFNAGYAHLRGTFDIVGNLDADITVPPDYFAFLLEQFVTNPRLGVAGTPFIENSDRPGEHSYAHGFAQLEHVSGACQLFRRQCFEAVGGYVPVKGGAVDWIAVTTARMKGWQTRTFTERVCHHHRALGTGTHHEWAVPFQYGRKAYYVGGHPVWETLRGLGWTRKKPVVIGGLMFLAGYFWALVTRTPSAVSKELAQFHRAEQMQRLRQLFHLRNARTPC